MEILYVCTDILFPFSILGILQHFLVNTTHDFMGLKRISEYPETHFDIQWGERKKNSPIWRKQQARQQKQINEERSISEEKGEIYKFWLTKRPDHLLNFRKLRVLL